MRLALLALLVLAPLAAAQQPDPSGGTVTGVHAEDVVVTPEGAQPVALVVRYSYVPVAAAASQGPTLVNLSFEVGDGLLLDPGNDSLAVEVPVDSRATPATGVTVEAPFPLRVYCAFPGILTFPEGNASFVVTAEARENGLLKASKGHHEVRVTCTDPDRAPSVPAMDAENGTQGPAATENGEKDAPLGAWVVAAALALAALRRSAG